MSSRTPWEAVHDALSVGWRVNRAEWHVEDDRWHAFAADHRPGRKQPDYVEPVGMDEAHCLRGLSELLRVRRAERGAGKRLNAAQRGSAT